MKERKLGIISLFIMAVGYFLIRYPLLFLHGMKDYPLILAGASGLIIIIGGIILPHGFLALFTSLGYNLGFIFSLIFKKQEFGLNNMWLIWLLVYFVAILMGLLLSIIKSRFKIRTKKEETKKNESTSE